MDKRNISTCKLCGKEYTLCKKCEESKSQWFSWKTIADNENCYKVIATVRDYELKVIDKEQAIKQLKDLDLSELETFTDKYKIVIKELMNKTVSEDITSTTVEDKNDEVLEVSKKVRKKIVSK